MSKTISKKGLDTKDYFEAKDSLRHWKPYMQHKAPRHNKESTKR